MYFDRAIIECINNQFNSSIIGRLADLKYKKIFYFDRYGTYIFFYSEKLSEENEYETIDDSSQYRVTSQNLSKLGNFIILLQSLLPSQTYND